MKSMIKQWVKLGVVSVVAAFSGITASASNFADLDNLLNKIEQGKTEQQVVIDQRLAAFRAKMSEQEALLAEAKAELQARKNKSASLEQQFANNEKAITENVSALKDRLGNLKELLGVLGQSTGDMISVIDRSPVTSQFPERRDFVLDLAKKAGSSNDVPSVAELQQFKTELFRELVHGGRIEQYSADYVDANGEAQTGDITRVGTFNIIKDGNYLNWDQLSGKLVEFAVQPKGSVLDSAAAVESAGAGELESFWLDPSSGSLLALEKEKPSLGERVAQGGVIGYIILALGAIGVLIALWRYIALGLTSLAIGKQEKSSQPGDNPLGRIMSVFKKHEDADTETLELHLSEAVTSEVPRVSKYISWIKIISVVAPLLGLLGTVTGMIDVFETMSLFGTGDPKLMAGGISQALVTTVLGLVVAIPTLFLHAFVNGRAKSIITTLEERSLGIMARHSEKAA